MSTFTSLGLAPDRTLNAIVVRYENGADAPRIFSAVEKVVGNAQGFDASDRHAVTGLSRIRIVPVLLLLGLLALVAAAVAHVLLVSVAGHRRDVAVLRAIGFTRPQSWAAVSVHASLLALAACVIGIPIGVVLGRLVWDRIAQGLFVVARPIAPVPALALMCVVLVAVAVVASLVPAWRAVRPRPAVVLRAD